MSYKYYNLETGMGFTSQEVAELRQDACTCGGDPEQPASHHDISCPAGLIENDEKRALACWEGATS